MRIPTGMLARTISAFALCMFLCGSSLALPPNASSERFTVGDFLLLYARSTGVTLPSEASPELAYEALKAARAIPSDPLNLTEPLTHSVVLHIGRAAGLKLRSRTPRQEFSRAEAEVFLVTFTNVLAPRPAAGAGETYAASFNPPGDPANRANTSKGKKKGRPFQSEVVPR